MANVRPTQRGNTWVRSGLASGTAREGCHYLQARRCEWVPAVGFVYLDLPYRTHGSDESRPVVLGQRESCLGLRTHLFSLSIDPKRRLGLACALILTVPRFEADTVVAGL